MKNNQKVPSIYDEANAYLMPEVDEQYTKTFKNLSDDEKVFIAQYPTYAAKFYLNSKTAKDLLMEIEEQQNNKRNSRDKNEGK